MGNDIFVWTDLPPRPRIYYLYTGIVEAKVAANRLSGVLTVPPILITDRCRAFGNEFVDK
eukprot:2844084-Amphidinium_carterae.1